MTMPECHFQPYDPLRKVLQQVAVPTAYVTFLCFVLFELLWLLAALALGSTVILRVTPLCGEDMQDVRTAACQPQLFCMWWGFYCYMFRPMVKEPSSGRGAQEKLHCKKLYIILRCPSAVTIVAKYVRNTNRQV